MRRTLPTLACAVTGLLLASTAHAGASRIGGFVRGGGGGVSPDDAAVVYTEDSAEIPLTMSDRTAGLFELGFDSQFYPGMWDVGSDVQLTLGPAFGVGLRFAGVGGVPAVGTTVFSGIELGMVTGNLHAGIGSHVGIGFTAARNVGTFENLPLDPSPADPTRRWTGVVSEEGASANVLYGDLPVIPMARVGYRVNSALFLLSVGYRLAPVRIGATLANTGGGFTGTPMDPEGFNVEPAFDPRGAFLELGVYGWKGDK